ASNIWEMGGLVYGNDNVPHPNLQYHFAPVYNEFHGRRISLSQGFQMTCDQLRPKSKGQIRLQSANPADRPSQQFNYLYDPYDLRELVEATRKMEELMQQPAMDKYRGKRINPAPDLKSNSDMEAYVRANASTDYHPCGTCRMGSDEMAVVDGGMKVHGIEGLHVVDASNMPDVVSGNLNAPTQMMAARAADFILGKDQLPTERPKFHFDE
ncbi:MAG: GMC oxidoreductase, partial [Pseudomonadota bacterium]